MSTEDIQELLAFGLRILQNDESYSDDKAMEWIRLRLEIELLRRILGLPII